MLYDKLKEFRALKAKQIGVNHYKIFHNSTLDDICEKLPTTIEELFDVHGFAEKKIQMYGNDIVKIVMQFG